RLDPPRVALRGQLVRDAGDDAQQGVELVRRPAQVVRGQQPDGHVGDAHLAAPVEQVDDVPGTDEMALADVVEAGGAGPAAIPVHHDGDVPGHRRALEVRAQAALVDRVDGVSDAHARAAAI